MVRSKLEKENRNRVVLMINYREMKYNCPYIYKEIRKFKRKIPVKLIWGVGEVHYTIPLFNKVINHREDGPAIYGGSRPEWGYGSVTFSEEEWLDEQWRKRSEIKRFL